ncbi:hypothetical protein EON65_46790 [archaeon]|nr:MAG: hypothetical protein EON65_46790 [archaeon]
MLVQSFLFVFILALPIQVYPRVDDWCSVKNWKLSDLKPCFDKTNCFYRSGSGALGLCQPLHADEICCNDFNLDPDPGPATDADIKNEAHIELLGFCIVLALLLLGIVKYAECAGNRRQCYEKRRGKWNSMKEAIKGLRDPNSMQVDRMRIILDIYFPSSDAAMKLARDVETEHFNFIFEDRGSLLTSCSDEDSMFNVKRVCYKTTRYQSQDHMYAVFEVQSSSGDLCYFKCELFRTTLDNLHPDRMTWRDRFDWKNKLHSVHLNTLYDLWNVAQDRRRDARLAHREFNVIFLSPFYSRDVCKSWIDVKEVHWGQLVCEIMKDPYLYSQRSCMLSNCQQYLERLAGRLGIHPPPLVCPFGNSVEEPVNQASTSSNKVTTSYGTGSW